MVEPGNVTLLLNFRLLCIILLPPSQRALFIWSGLYWEDRVLRQDLGYIALPSIELRDPPASALPNIGHVPLSLVSCGLGFCFHFIFQ